MFLIYFFLNIILMNFILKSLSNKDKTTIKRLDFVLNFLVIKLCQ